MERTELHAVHRLYMNTLWIHCRGMNGTEEPAAGSRDYTPELFLFVLFCSRLMYPLQAGDYSVRDRTFPSVFVHYRNHVTIFTKSIISCLCIGAVLSIRFPLKAATR